MEKTTKKPNTNELAKGSINNSLKLQNIDHILKHILKNLKGDLSQFNSKHALIIGTVESTIKVAKQLGFGLANFNNSTFVYNGNYWQVIDKDRLINFLGKCALKLFVKPLMAKHFDFKKDLYKQFLSTGYFPLPYNNKNIVKINLKNGTFVFNEGVTSLQPFNPNDFLTYQLPFKYNPEAEAPIFKNYLNRVLPDSSKQLVLAEYLGSIFIKNGSGAIKSEKVLMLYGSGANGKSVLNEVIGALLGNENVCSYTLQSLTDKNGYYRAMLSNKLLNYTSEINSKIEASMFKQLASGEPVEARLPYKDPFILVQYAKLMFNTNELPKSVEHTDAFFRRFIIIDFDQTIPEKEQDKSLHSKIINNELSGVFNWVLEGLKRFIKQNGFTNCEAINQTLNEYKSQSDNVNQYILENEYEPSPTSYKTIKEIYPEYVSFCRDSGYNPLNKINFNKRLKGLGFKIKRMSAGMAVYLSTEGSGFDNEAIEVIKKEMGFDEYSLPGVEF